MNKKGRTSLSVSIRRHFVDAFFFKEMDSINRGASFIDIGGYKGQKRGRFSPEEMFSSVVTVNMDASKNPDILADASSIPFPDNSFEYAIMGELLEHVSDPKPVIKEAYRLLKPGGKLFATVPFMFPVHADPYDYGRYTEFFWRQASKEALYSDISIESQGSLFAVMALGWQHFFRDKGGLIKRLFRKALEPAIISILMWLDRRPTSALAKSWTTGYGIIFTK